MTHPEEATEWNTIFGLLSLDRVIPFYEEMGLQLPDKQRSVEMLRRLLTESRTTYGPDLMPDMRFAEKVLKEIESLFGKETADHFYKWATTVFYWAPSDQAHWSIWDSLIPRRAHHLPPGLPSERWDSIAQFQQAINVDDVKQRARALRPKRLTEWDAETYAVENYENQEYPFDRNNEGIDPMSPVVGTIEMNRIQLAWPKLWSQFSDDEKNLFWNYGKQKVKEWEVEETVPGGLPHPDTLRRQI